MNTFINLYSLNLVFLSFLMSWYDIFDLLYYVVTTFVNIFFFFFFRNFKIVQAKPQSKSIQWFNLSEMGKTNRNSETNIVPNY